jgi:hypothetical protein
MSQIVSKPEHRTPIGFIDGKPVLASDRFQLYLDEIQEKMNTHLLGDQVLVPSYTVVNLPPVPETGVVFVSNESGGAVLAFSDGTDWRRVTDRAIVS